MTETHRALFGTSGWSYEDWNGIVYPEKKGKGFDELRFIADYFDAVELNVTFYRPAYPNMAKSWVRRTADKPDFRFTAKLHQRFTHQREAVWTPGEADEFKRGIEPLADAGKFGGILMQFPWSFKNTDEDRAWLEKVIHEFHAFPLFLEVRHDSWRRDDVFDWLDSYGVGFVNIDQPLFKGSLPPTERVTGGKGYVRLHGRNFKEWFSEDAGRDARYDYLYSLDELEEWVKKLRDITREAGSTYVMNNNHYRGQAAANSLELKSLFEDRKVRAPETLVRAYPRIEPLVEPERGEKQGQLM
jgi:uncharacterized protein YecE (DUF72 family)